MKQSLSPRDLARAIGVSESSLKRWADAGRIRVSRTVGGHRRIALSEAVRFVRDENMPVVRPDLLGLPELDRAEPYRGGNTDEVIFKKLRAGEDQDVLAILVDLYLTGTPLSELFDGPLRSAMSRLGELWAHSPKGIFIEHRATDIALHCVQMLRSMVDPPEADEEAEQSEGEATSEDVEAGGKRRIAVGGSPADDPYLLPSLMVACVLAEAGYREVNLGADTPIESLQHAAEAYEASVVWISSSVPEMCPPMRSVRELADWLEPRDAWLIIGGRGMDKLEISTLPDNVRRFGTMAELASFGRESQAAVVG